MTASGRPRRRWTGVVGALLLLAAGLGVAYPLWWNHRSTTVGATLIAKASSHISHVSNCAASSITDAAPGKGPGVLQIPSIGLTAPVLDGVTESVLNVAVGHPSGSLWPGVPGEAILEAHDVSYFANLQNVRVGARVIWTTPCLQAVFVVTGERVSAPGAVVPTPESGSGLALVTCYPTNALFWTNQRYLVTTSLISEIVGHQGLPVIRSTGTSLTVPAPASLAATGLALDQPGNSIVLDTLKIDGSPSSAWAAGPGPLQVESAALAVAFGAAKAIAQKNSTWWSAITVHGVLRPAIWPLQGATVNVIITMQGSTPLQVTLASAYAAATFSIQHNVIRLSSVS